MKNVTFVVSAVGRAKALLSGQKNVHAFIYGSVTPTMANLSDEDFSFEERVQELRDIQKENHNGPVRNISYKHTVAPWCYSSFPEEAVTQADEFVGFAVQNGPTTLMALNAKL